MVFLFTLIGIIIVIAIILMYSKIQIKIENFNFVSYDPKHINDDFLIVIKLCVLNKIPIFKLNLSKRRIQQKLNNAKMKEKLKDVENQILINKDKIDIEIIKLIKEIDINIKKLDLNIEIGTESAFLTSLLIPAISTILAIGLRVNSEKIENKRYIVKPVFINQNLIKILISGIFEVKLIHIMNIIYILKKKEGVKKNEQRTSNRRTYDYSYE